MVFKNHLVNPAVYPFPDSFMSAIKAGRMGCSSAGLTLNAITKKFYTLPSETMTDLKVPLVDGPVMALQSVTVLYKDGHSVLKDTVDCKNEAELKRIHDASSLVIKTSAVISSFTRTIVIWPDNLLKEVKPDPLVLCRSLLKIKSIAQFASVASLFLHNNFYFFYKFTFQIYQILNINFSLPLPPFLTSNSMLTPTNHCSLISTTIHLNTLIQYSTSIPFATI